MMDSGIAGLSSRGVPGRKAAARGPLAGQRREAVGSGERDAVQPAAALRTLPDIDSQQGHQPHCRALRRLLEDQWHTDAQQLPAQRQTPALDAVGQQTVMADAAVPRPTDDSWRESRTPALAQSPAA